MKLSFKYGAEEGNVEGDGSGRKGSGKSGEEVWTKIWIYSQEEGRWDRARAEGMAYLPKLRPSQSQEGFDWDLEM